MRRALPALLAVVVAAVAAAGCGDSGSSSTVPTKAEYKQTYRALHDEVAATGVAVNSGVSGASGKSGKDLEVLFGGLADRARADAGKVTASTPPDDANIKKAVSALADGLNRVAKDLDAISLAARKNDLKGASVAAAKLNADDIRVEAPLTALDFLVLGKRPPSSKATTTTKASTTTTTP